MDKFVKWIFGDKEGLSREVVKAFTGFFKFLFLKKFKNESLERTNSSINITGDNNVVGDTNIGRVIIQGNFIAEQNAELNCEEHKKYKRTWFSERFDTFQNLMNNTRVFAEKEYTTEYISFLLGLSGVEELKRFLDDGEEPDDLFKKKFVDIFGLNEEWIMFNRGECPFASNQRFYGDDPMDILRNNTLNNIDSFIMIIGKIEGKRYAIIVKKYSEVHYEVIAKEFIFYPEVGRHGESMLVNLYRFVRETERINKLFPSVYVANEKETMNILKGTVPAKIVFRFPVIRNFESIFLDLNNEDYDLNHLDKDIIQIKKIIRERISEIDNINQTSDRRMIMKNLGQDNEI